MHHPKHANTRTPVRARVRARSARAIQCPLATAHQRATRRAATACRLAGRRPAPAARARRRRLPARSDAARRRRRRPARPVSGARARATSAADRAARQRDWHKQREQPTQNSDACSNHGPDQTNCVSPPATRERDAFVLANLRKENNGRTVRNIVFECRTTRRLHRQTTRRWRRRARRRCRCR